MPFPAARNDKERYCFVLPRFTRTPHNDKKGYHYHNSYEIYASFIISRHEVSRQSTKNYSIVASDTVLSLRAACGEAIQNLYDKKSII
jgi:hypothetical protein